jgi:hypothetical protein
MRVWSLLLGIVSGITWEQPAAGDIGGSAPLFLPPLYRQPTWLIRWRNPIDLFVNNLPGAVVKRNAGRGTKDRSNFWTNYTDRTTAACRRSDCQLFADRGWYVVSVTDPLLPYSRFSRQEPLLFYQVAPQLYSRGWVDPVPEPLPFFFLVVPGIEHLDLRICTQELWTLDHRGGKKFTSSGIELATFRFVT